MTSWSTADIPDQTGRLVVVTGANSGIGLEAARELARKGAHVVLAVRDLRKGAQAQEDIAASASGASTEVRALDLADLDSVREFAAQLVADLVSDPVADLAGRRIDVLINNAGIMAPPLDRTPAGFESQFGTNVLGHFLLTNLLLDSVSDRVVWLSSNLHKRGTIDLQDPNFERRPYDRWAAYGQSKLADLMLAYELQRRFAESGSPRRSVAAHPGWSTTNLQKDHGGLSDKVMTWGNKLPFLAQPASGGALPTLYAATVPDLPGGSYIGPGGFMEMQGPPRQVGSSPASYDTETASALWALCESLTGLREPA